MATRFNITEEDLRSSAESDDVAMEKIPILKRRAAAAVASSAAAASNGGDPVCVVVVGMAGSGKTTLMAQLQRSLNLEARVDGDATNGEDDESKRAAHASTLPKGEGDEKKKAASPDLASQKTSDLARRGYAINLDPAAKYVPFSSSIDIRDTVDYLEVMRQHKLGPNGAILTCLNLFATKFDQVMGILENRAFGPGEDVGGEWKKEGEQISEPKTDIQSEKTSVETVGTLESSSVESSMDYILVDTPGQIEAFTWSASGTIVTSALATTFPTVLAFVVDTPRCAASVHTFMSNMLYACSMLYRAKLPMIIVLNKTDVVGCEFIKEWMEDYESFQEALDDASSSGNGYSDEMAGGSGYYSSLTRSLSLVLDEFYNHLHKVGVSAATGEGVDEFWEVVQKAAVEYEEGYLVDLKHRIDEQQAKERAKKRVDARRLARDLEQDGAA